MKQHPPHSPNMANRSLHELGAGTEKVPLALTQRSPFTFSIVARISLAVLGPVLGFLVRSFLGDSQLSHPFVGSASRSGVGSVCGRSGFEKEARRI